MRTVLDRRGFVRGAGAVAIAAGLAGCSGGGGDSGDGGDDGNESGHGGGDGMGSTETEAESGTETATQTETSSAPAEVEDYLSDTSNYDGIADETGTGNVEVEVGAEGNSGNFAFEPAAVRVDAGTDVIWSWTGEGGQHNVVHTEGEFESELVEGSGNDFQHPFEEAGVYLYYCTPHRSLGMKGAVIVE